LDEEISPIDLKISIKVFLIEKAKKTVLSWISWIMPWIDEDIMSRE